MSKKSLREQLMGTWTLASCVPRDIGAEDRPFGERRLGLLLHTRDGYMSAQLRRPERHLFADGDFAHAIPEEFADAGSYREMAVSFFPNWLGQKQVRLVEIDGERLQLGTDGPQAIFSGSLKAATLTWRRAQPN